MNYYIYKVNILARLVTKILLVNQLWKLIVIFGFAFYQDASNVTRKASRPESVPEPMVAEKAEAEVDFELFYLSIQYAFSS